VKIIIINNYISYITYEFCFYVTMYIYDHIQMCARGRACVCVYTKFVRNVSIM